MGVKRNLDESGILEDSDKITEDEAALYDRQIRLWGMESQKRLREAKILVVGLNGVVAEVVKNLTLSGVKQITLLDDTVVLRTDFTAQFFLSADKIGAPRAESSVSAIRELNPNVKVDVVSGDILSKSEDFYKEFHAMIVTDCSVDILIKLNEICRKHDIQFYCTDTWGFFGYCFLDLQTHAFKNCSFSPEKAKDGKKEKSERKSTDESVKYCPLAPTLSAKVGDGLRKRVSKVFVLLHIINNFQEMQSRSPGPEFREKDVEELKKIRQIVCDKLGYDASKISDETLSLLFGQLSPVCAVVGGVLATEVIKGISRNGLPIYNYFLFDGCESVGVNEKILPEPAKQ